MRTDHHSEGDIFEAALAATDSTKRTAYLDQACAGHPELRQRIESLLAAPGEASITIHIY